MTAARVRCLEGTWCDPLRRGSLNRLAALNRARAMPVAPQPAWLFLLLYREVRLPSAFGVVAVYRMGNRIIVKTLTVESAGEFQQLGGLLAELPGRNHGLLAGGLVGEAGLPRIESALCVACSGAPEMFDHRVLVAQDHILIARAEFPVDRVAARRTDDHEIGLKEQRLFRLDVAR
jgi:hypothetical protein